MPGSLCGAAMAAGGEGSAPPLWDARAEEYLQRVKLLLGRTQTAVVKPHTPLIKFPDRKSGPRPKIQESLQASIPSPHASKAQEAVGGRPLAFQNISSVSRVHGAPDTSELARILPQKYRRKLMSVEEIEYIQRGGPE